MIPPREAPPASMRSHRGSPIPPRCPWASPAAVNRQRRTDKGFGPALGPTAASEAIGRFERLRYSVVQAKSDWVLGPDDGDIQLESVAGWASAARDIGDLSLGDIANWLVRR